ncbi:MAG: hypothetical protein B6244_00295 [Candidatus Cloacimonetes bacterium 4572_55]|nr:MAG: hypothetical protein B6244_00295 [Candidatus Cloacimonetes bacterium 4572_55]
MRLVFILLLSFLFQTISLRAQPLERIIQNVPVFAGYANVQAVDNILTVGIMSDSLSKTGEEALEMFKKLKTWNHEGVIKILGHKKVEVVSLNKKNIDEFKGQILWVMNASTSLQSLKALTEKGVFTIALAQPELSDHIFVTVTFENKSDDPAIERWRLTKLEANCKISPLRFVGKLAGKSYFIGRNCD